MDNIECLYWGLFFDDLESLDPLDIEIENKHVTFAFKKPFPIDLLGKEATVEIIGYGNDGLNEGYEIAIPDWCQDRYDGAYPVHITLSLSENASAKDTANLDFESVVPYDIDGYFAYVAYDQSINMG